jgi:hypothetical protein
MEGILEMVRKLYLCFSLFLIGMLVSAQSGEQVFSFLNLPVSTAASGVGGNSVSSQERDLNLVFHNPAQLDVDLTNTAEVGYLNYLSDIRLGSLVYSHELNEHSSWMAGVRYLNYGTMLWTDSEGSVLGTTSASDLAMTGVYGLKLNHRWRAGVSLSLLYSVLDDYTSVGLCSDLGLYYFNPDQLFSAGFVLKNMGAQVNPYDEVYESMPWDIQLGVSKKLAHAPLRFSVTFQGLSHPEIRYIEVVDGEETLTTGNLFNKIMNHTILGVEFVPSSHFLLSLGYNYRRFTELAIAQRTPFAGFTAGFALNVKSVRIGVSYAKYHVAGNSLQLTYAMNLSKHSK